MGQETVAAFQETEKQNLSCATANEGEVIVSSCKSKDGVSVSETVIGIPKEFPKSENGCPTSSVDSGSQLKNSGENTKVVEKQNEGKSWVIDVNCGDEKKEEEEEEFGELEEKVCRICHLGADQAMKGSPDAKTELIKLGCACNGELSFAHSYCAEAWFKLKGNRVCEICGQTVTNIRGIGDEVFMEEWVENGINGNTLDSSDRNREGCWHGQPFCNFLMACLVIAFVVPWFFRINMF